jgi:protease-4
MPLDSDVIVDRRHIRRKLTFWRVATVLIVAVAVVGGAFIFTGGRTALTGGPGGSTRITVED